MHYFKHILNFLSCVIVIGCGIRNSPNEKDQKNSDLNSDGKYWYVSPYAKKELWNPAPWLKLESQEKFVFTSAQIPWGLTIQHGEEKFADALINFKEQTFLSWTKGLKLGGAEIPKREFRLEFVDDTRGRVKGFEKFLNINYINEKSKTQNVSEFSPLAKRWKERCPVLFQPNSFLNYFPLKVVWTDQDAIYMPKKGVQGFYRSIFDTMVDNKVSWDVQTQMAIAQSRTPVLQNRHYNDTIPAIYLLSEDKLDSNPTESQKRQQLKYGNQGSWENCGKPLYEWDQYCENGTVFPLDETLSHEFGHHVFDTWAASYGKHIAQSVTFSENMAELFKAVCYGDTSEAPYKINYKSEYKTAYDDPKFWEKSRASPIKPYQPEPFGGIESSINSVAWLKNRGTLDSNKIFTTVLKTWEIMEGTYTHRVYCDEKTWCPWGENRRLPLKEQISTLDWANGEPRVWSYIEFLEKFMQIYEFETPEMKKGFEQVLKEYKLAAIDNKQTYGWEY